MFELDFAVVFILVGFELVTFLSIYLSMTTLSGRLHSFALCNALAVLSFIAFTIICFDFPVFGRFLFLLSGLFLLRGALMFREEVRT